MLHQSFDWTCRKNKSSLVKNMALVVKGITGLLEVDINPSSPLYKAATKCYDLVKLKKNSRLGKEKFLKTEKETLEKYMVELEGKEDKEQDDALFSDDESAESSNPEEEESDAGEADKQCKVTVQRGKRKDFKDLKKRQKRARLDNIIKIIKDEGGIEEKLVEKIKSPEEHAGNKKEKEEEFKLACLNGMKQLGLSDTKFDDLRFWLADLIQRGFNLLEMPASTTLKAKVRKEMIPRDMRSSETGAEFDISDALFHTGQRFLERPDVRQHLKNGDTMKHLAKVGSDFAAGFGKVQQVKTCDFDEDGSHNKGFQSLKLSRGEQDLFVNKAPGGSELLRLVSKTTHKDTVERMVAEMEALDRLCQEVPKQEVHVEGVGLVMVEHHLVNTLHDGKERLATTQHKV